MYDVWQGIKERIVPLGSKAVEALKEYITHGRVKLQGNGWTYTLR